jgi:hypothetical protein
MKNLFYKLGNFLISHSGRGERQPNKPIRFPAPPKRAGLIHPGLKYRVWENEEEEKRLAESTQQQQKPNN